MKIILLYSTLIICLFTNAQSTHVNGPIGSGEFGRSITILSNGNYVVTDPLFDDGTKADVGAAYLYNGSTHALISTLKGSTANDQVGSHGIIVLSNGNYLIHSFNWNNGTAFYAGAVTWGSATTGVSGVVGPSNSLVGSKANDRIGNSGILVLSNGNYLVLSTVWDNGAAIDAGAVTWGSDALGVTGVVSESNSLVGSTSSDQVGSGGATLLSNGNYIVNSPTWDNGSISNAGAVTWGSGNSGISGAVSASNSLVGSTADNIVGNGGITILTNSNYVVRSSRWDNGTANDVGAVTWGNGTSGIIGAVSASNSLVGSTVNDQVGSGFIIALSNGNYVVNSPFWDNGAISNVGAVTWGNGTTGISGLVSASNSLVGSLANDQVGIVISTALSNGNYVVRSYNWDNGAASNAGAVTWGNGTSGITGAVSASNSLVGSTANDQVGINGITALSNGNYVVISRQWDNGAATDAGAVTWGNGTSGISGVISSSNSLVGSSASDQVGINGVAVLSNSNYVVISPNWNNGAATNAGAVTWGNGTSGISGVVSTSNSLVGSTTNNLVGSNGITALSNGNYLVMSPSWDDGTSTDLGAVTWSNGTTGISGVVSASNSLVGSSALDQVGVNGISLLSNGNYVVRSNNWDNGAVTNAGAVTWGNSNSGISGAVSASNSLVGSKVGDQVGSSGITVLSNGNYVVNSSNWDNGTAIQAGAVTWGNGNTGISGVVSVSNSLVGGTANNFVGNGSVIALANGNYVVRSFNWDNGAVSDVGAITWGSGTKGISGVVSESNSLIGSTANNLVGSASFNIFPNGYFVVRNPNWDNGTATDAGAFSLGNESKALTGVVNSCNSVLGNAANGGSKMISAFNTVHSYLLVGRPGDNILTIFNPIGQPLAVHLDSTSANIEGNTAVPLVNNACRIIASIQANGVNPVMDLVPAKVWIETNQTDSFVKRHFEITPIVNNNNATAKVILYFTQSEFDDFNAVNTKKLPTSGSDAQGKSNLRIIKRAGNSINNTGLPGSYIGAVSTIDPPDSNIVFNSQLSRWEVSFDVLGFSGFFVNTGNKVTSLTELPKNLNNVELFPNPTNGILNILSHYNQDFKLKLMDISGKLLIEKTFQGNGTHLLDLSNFLPGIYLVKLSTGETFKVIKQ